MTSYRRSARRPVWFRMTLTLFVLALTALAPAGEAPAQGPDMPLQFKMTGKFLEPEKGKQVGGVNAFTVNVLKKTWVWDIERADTLQGAMLGSTVLNQIYPPIMTFTGPEEITGRLVDPAIEGKPLTLTGQLYLKKRIFRVNTVEGPPAEEGEGDSAAH